MKVITGRLARPDVADLIAPPVGAGVDAKALRAEAASIRRNPDEMAASLEPRVPTPAVDAKRSLKHRSKETANKGGDSRDDR